MSGGGTGEQDARAASELQTRLFQQYAATGKPALQAAIGYTRGALKQGLPGYVENAYRQAQVGALEQNVSDLGGLRRSIAARGDASQLGGSFITGQAGAIGSAGDALTREMAGIRTSRAVAGVEQRNKLLGILAGGSATATNLSAAFGSLGNRAMSLNAQPDPTMGYVNAGLSTATGLYAALSRPNSSSGILGFNPNAGGGVGGGGTYNPYLNAWQGGGGTVDLTRGMP